VQRLTWLWLVLALPLAFMSSGCFVWNFFFPAEAPLKVQFGEIDRYKLEAPYRDVVDATLRRLARDGVKMADRSESSAMFSASPDADDEGANATLELRDHDDILYVVANTKPEATQKDHDRLSRARGAIRNVPGVGAEVDVNGELVRPQDSKVPTGDTAAAGGSEATGGSAALAGSTGGTSGTGGAGGTGGR